MSNIYYLTLKYFSSYLHFAQAITLIGTKNYTCFDSKTNNLEFYKFSLKKLKNIALFSFFNTK